MALLVSGLGTIYALMQFGSESTKDSKRNVYFRYGLKIGFTFNFLLMIGIILFSNLFPFEIKEAHHIVLLMCFMPICIYAFELIQTYFRTGLYNVEFSRLSTTNTFYICSLNSRCDYLWNSGSSDGYIYCIYPFHSCRYIFN